MCRFIGKPEPLKYVDADLWSRRINLEHRLVYRVGQTQIDFLALTIDGKSWEWIN